MKEKNQIPEKADLTGNVTQMLCNNCFEDYLFALKDKNHEFTIGLIDILRCLKFAENECAVPKISPDWWISVTEHFGDFDEE